MLRDKISGKGQVSAHVLDGGHSGNSGVLHFLGQSTGSMKERDLLRQQYRPTAPNMVDKKKTNQLKLTMSTS